MPLCENIIIVSLDSILFYLICLAGSAIFMGLLLSLLQVDSGGGGSTEVMVYSLGWGMGEPERRGAERKRAQPPTISVVHAPISPDDGHEVDVLPLHNQVIILIIYYIYIYIVYRCIIHAKVCVDGRMNVCYSFSQKFLKVFR